MATLGTEEVAIVERFNEESMFGLSAKKWLLSRCAVNGELTVFLYV